MTNDFTWLHERGIVLGAVRWYLGRSTIAAHGVAKYIGEHVDNLDKGTREIMADTIRDWLDNNPTCGGAVDDRKPWADLLARLEDCDG